MILSASCNVKYNVHPNHASLKHRKVAPLSACPGINSWGNSNVLIMSLLFLFIVNGKWKIGRITGQRWGGGRHYWCLQGSILEHSQERKDPGDPRSWLPGESFSPVATESGPRQVQGLKELLTTDEDFPPSGWLEHVLKTPHCEAIFKRLVHNTKRCEGGPWSGLPAVHFHKEQRAFQFRVLMATSAWCHKALYPNCSSSEEKEICAKHKDIVQN